MQLTINLPSREQTIALGQSRWGEFVSDPVWAQVEGKFETNSFGQLIVNPPPSFFHNDRAYRISEILKQQLGGHGRTDVPVATIDGVKQPDAAWLSDGTYQQTRGKLTADRAPEICVEVLSPSNTDAELTHKRGLYFDAGANECWQCDLDGRMTYYTADAPGEAKTKSPMCPEFPDVIQN